MSNITIPSAVGTPLGTVPDTATNSTPPKPASTPAPGPVPVANPTDNITLSVGAQAATAVNPATPALSDSAASAQSVSLRQQLGNTPLSGTARQNQAIVALLR